MGGKAGDAGEARSELLETLVGYALRRASGTVMADFMATMEDLSIRPVLFGMLAMTRENPGINQTALGQALGIQRANLVPLVNELTARKLVERRPAPNDRRAFALYLTGEGDTLLDEAVTLVRSHEEKVLARLSAKERQQLLAILAKIRAG